MASLIILDIRRELKKHVDKPYRQGSIRFFKEPIRVYGVRAKIVRSIAKKFFKQLQGSSKEKIFVLCEELLASGINEESTIAFSWAYHLKNAFSASDFRIFESWLKKYVSNWAMCDDFCTHPFGYLLTVFPALIPNINAWTRSKNRWLRRAAAVILIPNLRRKHALTKAFEISDILLHDSDDLVQKGYGWTLKVAADIFPNQVFQWVLERKSHMPRTALRYAIEKFPLSMRREALER